MPGHRKSGSEASGTNMEQRDGIIAAIPCFNEEPFIGSLVLKAKGYAERVIVIDDGSGDNTALIAEEAGATVVKHSSNLGKGAAVRTAFEHAREMGCRALVLLDGDGQHEPAYIPYLVQPVLNGEADMVVGSRFLDIHNSIPRYRLWGHRLLTFLTNLGSRVKLSDSQNGFRAFSPKAVDALSFAENGLSIESEMQFLANDAHLKVAEVPVAIMYHDLTSRSPITHGVEVLESILRLITRRHPLLFFGVPGMVMLCVGIWEGWRVVQGYYASGEFWVGLALLAVLLCIIGSLCLFAGLILHNIRPFLRRD